MNDDIINLKKSQIKPSGWNPRTEEDREEFEALKRSVDALGIRVPLIVRPKDTDGRYPLVAGERRWKASSNTALIPCVVQKEDVLDAKLTTLVENLVRESVSSEDHERFIHSIYEEGRDKRWKTMKDMSMKTGIPEWLIKDACQGYETRQALKLPREVSRHITSGDLRESSTVKDADVRRKLLTERAKAKQSDSESILKKEAHVVHHVSTRVKDLPKKVALEYLSGNVSDDALDIAREARKRGIPDDTIEAEVLLNAERRKHTKEERDWVDEDTEYRLLKGMERKVLLISTSRDKVALKKYSAATELVRKMSAIDLNGMKDAVVKDQALRHIRYMILALSTILLQTGQSVPYVRLDLKGNIIEADEP